MNNKRFIVLGIIFILLVGLVYTPRLISGDNTKIKFKEMDKENIPDKLNEIISSYLQEERALACRLDNQVFVLVTMGKQDTGGYSINIKEMSREEEIEDGFSLLVTAEFRQPEEDELIIKNATFPYIVLETNLKQMPGKVELIIENDE